MAVHSAAGPQHLYTVIQAHHNVLQSVLTVLPRHQNMSSNHSLLCNHLETAAVGIGAAINMKQEFHTRNDGYASGLVKPYKITKFTKRYIPLV